jgi:hypothetical protein
MHVVKVQTKYIDLNGRIILKSILDKMNSVRD